MPLRKRLITVKYFFWGSLLFWFFGFTYLVQGQQVLWAKHFLLEKRDDIQCIVQDSEHFLYAGGSSLGKPIVVPGGFNYDQAMIMKLDELGDTMFIRYLNIPGKVYSMAIDPYGMIRVNISQEYFGPNGYNTYFISMTSDGLVFKKDSIGLSYPYSCLIGKDSSLIIVGRQDIVQTTLVSNMYFQRITKDGYLDPIIILNPGHPNSRAHRVEQLPNGHYLISGTVGSRIASYEVNEDGSNPVFKQWYQTPTLNNFNSGVVAQNINKNYMVGGSGSPSVIGLFDSSGQKLWLRSDTGIQVPPQSMKDGSVLTGYVTGVGVNNTLFRIAV